MRKAFSILLLIGAIFFVAVAMLPFAFAQDAAIAPAPEQHVDPLTIILGIALAISEAMALSSKIASNGIFQCIFQVLKKLNNKSVPVILLCLTFLTMAGCGKSLDQIRYVAHQLIDVAGKVYEDVKDNADMVKKVVTEPAPKQ